MLEAQLAKNGAELPEHLRRPELRMGLGRYLDMFWNLSTCRPLGFGCVGPVPWTAIMAMAEYNEIDEEEVGYFTALIRAADAVYLARANKKTGS